MHELVQGDSKNNCISYFESIRPGWGDVLAKHIEEVENGETESIFAPGYYEIKTFGRQGKRATSAKIYGNEKPKIFAWYV